MTRLLFAALAAGLIGATAGADDPKLPGPKIEFPDVKGLTQGKPRTFPEAALGYSVGYSAPGLVITVYVYDKGLTEIPTGAKSQLVKDEMKQIVSDLEEVRKQGLYKSVKEVGKEEVIQLGKGKDAPAVLRRKFAIDNPKTGERLSEAYVTGYKNHFIKLRITYDPEGKEELEKKIATFLDALGTALK